MHRATDRRFEVSARASLGNNLVLLLLCHTATAVCLILAALLSPLDTDVGMRDSRTVLLAAGIVAAGLTIFFGLRVHFAVIPRARLMIQCVRHFQESGVYQRIGDVGRDDLGTLANALDAGLSSITQRQREREEFLEIVAHELKTPVTSIQGYASLLVGQPDAAFKTSALESIYRQSWRLSRLMDGLFLAMRARSQKLQFSPSPIDMSELVQHVIDEMKPFVTDKTFSPRIQSRVAILADEGLLGHALWSLFTCAAALSADRKPVRISLAKVDHRARLTVDIEKTSVPLPEVRELFIPFREIQFETGASMRSSIGLYLTREIVRIHNGDLQVQEVSDTQPEFVMELPL